MAEKKILVIDDMPHAATMVKARLEASGYRVITASDGQQGLTSAQAEKPDLILLDIVMPAGGGYSVFTQLKTSPKTRSIPVIFLTAKDRPEDVARAYKLGVQYYVKKPYEPEVLLETVKKALGPSALPPPAQRGLRKRILVVIGKDSEVTEFAKLREMGYEVTVVLSIQEGSDEARKEMPDVIVLDGMVVKANHYDGYYRLKLEFPLSNTPLILLVSQEEKVEFQRRIEGLGAYCLKPINFIDLLGHVRMAIHKT